MRYKAFSFEEKVCHVLLCRPIRQAQDIASQKRLYGVNVFALLASVIEKPSLGEKNLRARPCG